MKCDPIGQTFVISEVENILTSFFVLLPPYSKEDKSFCVLPVSPMFKKTKFTYSSGDLTFELRNAQIDTPSRNVPCLAEGRTFHSN